MIKIMELDLVTRYLDSLADDCTQATIHARAGVLRRAEAALPLGLWLAGTDDIAAWLKDHDWRAETKRAYIMHLRGWYGWLVQRGHLDRDPMIGVPSPRPGRPIPRPVPDWVIALMLQRLADPWRRAAILAAYAGLRCCELAALNREDIDEHDIHIRSGKGGKEALIPTHDLVWEVVRDLPSGPVIASRSGRRLTAQQVSNRSHYAIGRALGDDVPKSVPTSIHKLRHSYCTRLLDETGDLSLVASLARHAHMQTTRGYAKVAGQKRRAAIKALTVP